MYKAVSTKETFDTLFEKVKNGDKFYYVRNGDGELGTIDGMTHRQYRDPPQELRDHLKKALEVDDPNYLIAINDIHEREEGMRKRVFWDERHQKIVGEALEKIGLKKQEFHNAIALHYYYCFRRKELDAFVDLLKPIKKMYVGGQPADRVADAVGVFAKVVQVPRQEAYFEHCLWYPNILKALPEVDMIVAAAGWCSNVMALWLWESGWKGTFLDLGSLVDALIGEEGRGWITETKKSS